MKLIASVHTLNHMFVTNVDDIGGQTALWRSLCWKFIKKWLIFKVVIRSPIGLINIMRGLINIMRLVTKFLIKKLLMFIFYQWITHVCNEIYYQFVDIIYYQFVDILILRIILVFVVVLNFYMQDFKKKNAYNSAFSEALIKHCSESQFNRTKSRLY